MVWEPEPLSAAEDIKPADVPRFRFPNPSGGAWTKEDQPSDRAPRAERSTSNTRVTEDGASVKSDVKPETPLQRRKRIEKRLGKFYMGIAKGVDNPLGQDYLSTVLISQSDDFVDSVMEIAEDNPRVLEWLDSKAMVSGYWKLAAWGISVGLAGAAYYGYAPEFLVDWLDVPPLPKEPTRIHPDIESAPRRDDRMSQ